MPHPRKRYSVRELGVFRPIWILKDVREFFDECEQGVELELIAVDVHGRVLGLEQKM